MKKNIPRPGGLNLVVLIVAVIAAAVHLSCGSTSYTRAHFVEAAGKRYRGDVECLPNKSGLFLLCVNRVKVAPGDPRQPVRFMVFSLEREQAVFEDSLDNAEVRWLNEDEIEVDMIPEVADDGSMGSGYLMNILSGKRSLIPAQEGNQ